MGLWYQGRCRERCVYWRSPRFELTAGVDSNITTPPSTTILNTSTVFPPPLCLFPYLPRSIQNLGTDNNRITHNSSNNNTNNNYTTVASSLSTKIIRRIDRRRFRVLLPPKLHSPPKPHTVRERKPSLSNRVFPQKFKFSTFFL